MSAALAIASPSRDWIHIAGAPKADAPYLAPVPSLRSGITSTDPEDLTRWLEWAHEGDIIRIIRFPVETYQLHQGGVSPGRQFFLDLVLNRGDLALIKAPCRDLVLMTEETFHEMAGGAE